MKIKIYHGGTEKAKRKIKTISVLKFFAAGDLI